MSQVSKDKKSYDINYYKKRAKRNRRRRRMLMLIFLLSVLICFALFAPYFQIKSIICSGNKKVDTKSIIAASSVGIGNNIYRTSLRKAKDNIMERLPYIKDVEAKRLFPNSIKFTVKESTVAAYIQAGKSYIYIDSNGKVLEKQNVPPKEKVPIIENAQINSSNVGKFFTSKNPKKFDFIIATMRELVHNNIMQKVTIINIPDVENLSFSIDNKLEVKVGSKDNLTYKIGFLTVKSYESLGPDAKGTLDISSGKEGFFKEK